jgi:hypothetical protein
MPAFFVRLSLQSYFILKSSILKKILMVALMSVAIFSCKKEDEPTVTPTTSNAAAGNWTIAKYDGLVLTTPSAGTLTMTSTSATAGTAHFDLTFDGTNHSIEDDSYALSNNNTNIVYTKTGGSYNVLSGGGTWVINTMTATELKITSANGLIIECTK